MNKIYIIVLTIINMDWSYVAGFIDGEGSIIIYDKKNTSKRVLLSIPNTYVNVLYDIKDFIKCGHVNKYKRHKKHHKDFAIYHISSHKEVLFILENLLPYLIVKKQKAIDAIQFIKKTNWDHGLKLDNNKILLLKNQGKSLREIGKEIGVSHITIKNRLYKLKGVKIEQ